MPIITRLKIAGAYTAILIAQMVAIGFTVHQTGLNIIGLMSAFCIMFAGGLVSDQVSRRIIRRA